MQVNERHDALIQSARKSRRCKASLRELARELPADPCDLNELLQGLVRDGDDVAFSRILLAALDAGALVSASLLVDGAPLLVDERDLIAASLHCGGDVTSAILSSLERHRTPLCRQGTMLFLAGYRWSQHPEDPVPKGLIALGRMLARDCYRDPLPSSAALALANMIDDAGMQAILKVIYQPRFIEDSKKIMDRLLQPVVDSPLGHLPNEPGEAGLSGYTVRRAVEEVGRNDPCPCGSGKKYKRCCLEKDQERLQRSSSVAGLTVEELRERPEPYLTEEMVRAMRPHEIARIDPTLVPPAFQYLMLRTLLDHHEHQIFIAVFEKIGYRGVFSMLIEEALYRFSGKAAEESIDRLVALIGDDLPSISLPVRTRLVLARNDPRAQLELIEQEAMQCVLDTTKDRIDLGISLMETGFPALGMLVTRGVIPFAFELDAETALDVLLETRDRLNLSPEDPIEDVYHRLFLEDASRDSVRSEDASGAMREAEIRYEQKRKEVVGLQTELSEVRRRLSGAETRLAEASREKGAPPKEQQAIPNSETEDLRATVKALEGMLHERHAERNEIRRELQKTKRDLEALKSQSVAKEDHARQGEDGEEEALLLEEERSFEHPLRLPVFPVGFQQSLSHFPKHVASATMRLIGELSAGDPSAFRGSRRLRLNREILRQRVGAKHRLLFRLTSDALHILQLVDRQDLRKAIKSLA